MYISHSKIEKQKRYIKISYKHYEQIMEPIKQFDAFFQTQKPHHISNNGHEPESEMLIAQLKNIMENAKCLISMVEGQKQIEDWVQSKITIADDYLDTLNSYFKHSK